MIHIVDVCKSFGKVDVLKSISAHIRTGESILLAGDNGTGKTTLLNMLSGHVLPDSGHIYIDCKPKPIRIGSSTRFQRLLDASDLALPQRLAQSGILRSWQDLQLFNELTVEENLCAAAQRQVGELLLGAIFLPQTVNRQEERICASVRHLASRVLLSPQNLGALARSISLGEAKRLSVARALAADSTVLFLDEPFSGLDSRSARALQHILLDLRAKNPITLVLVEHHSNIEWVLPLVSAVWRIEHCSIAQSTPNVLATEKDVGCPSALGFRSDRNWEEHLLDDSATLRISHSTCGKETVLKISDVDIYGESGTSIGDSLSSQNRRSLSFELRRGDLALLEAPNGWGKTTLAKMLSGSLVPCRGEMVLEGRRIEKLPPWARSQLGLLFLQSRNNTFDDLTVNEVLELAGVNNVPETVARIGQRRSGTLSGGERQVVALSLALLRPNLTIAILDEPFRSLDIHARQQWASIIEGVTSRAAVLVMLPRQNRLVVETKNAAGGSD